MGFYDTLKGSHVPEAGALGEKIKAPEQGFYATLKASGTVAKVGAKAALKKAGDLIGPPARFLGSVMEAPIAYSVHALGEMDRTMPPVQFSPTSGVEQLRASGTPHPELVDLGANLLVGGGMNALGAKVAMPLFKAGIEPLRGIPGVADALEFTKTGASLTAKYRRPAQDILRTEEGALDLSIFRREAALAQYKNLPLASQERVQTAIERRAIESLGPEERIVAEALEAEYASRPGERVAAGRTPHELGAHIGQAEEAARQAKLQFMAKRGLATQAKEMEVPNLFGGKGYSVNRPLVDTGRYQKNLAEKLIPQGMGREYSEGVKYLNSPEAWEWRNRAKTAQVQARTADIEQYITPQRMKMIAETPGALVQSAPIRSITAPLPVEGAATEPHTFGLSSRTVGSQRNEAAQAAKRMRQLEREATKASQGVPEAQRVSFTDRPLSPEARSEMGIKRYGSATPSGLSTGGLGRRIANPGKTTAEINAELVAEGKTPIGPVVQAALEAGERSDIGNMHARIVRSLMDHFGEPTSDPMLAVARHQGIPTGFDAAMTKRLETTKLPPEVDRLVSRLNKRMEPEEWNRAQEAMQWVNRGFKKWALFSGGYVSRNLQNNLFQIALFEDIGPKELANGPRIFAKIARPDQATMEEWIRNGVVGRGQTAQEIKGQMGPIFKGAKALNTQVEDKSRALLYELRRLKGDTPQEAASRVDDILFNYSPRLASRARRVVGRDFVPFVNWSTFIPGLTARALVERPGSVALFSNMRDRQNESLGYTDERLAKEFGPWNNPQGVVATGEGQGFVPQFAGQYSLNELVPTSFTEAADKLLSKLYPTASVPAALGTGREPFSSRPFEYGEGDKKKDRFATAPSSLRAIFLLPGGDEFAAAHGISIDPDTKKVMAPARLAYVLGAFPQARIANIVADWVAGVKGKEGTAKSFLIGVRPVEKYEPKGARR